MPFRFSGVPGVPLGVEPDLNPVVFHPAGREDAHKIPCLAIWQLHETGDVRKFARAKLGEVSDVVLDKHYRLNGRNMSKRWNDQILVDFILACPNALCSGKLT